MFAMPSAPRPPVPGPVLPRRELSMETPPAPSLAARVLAAVVFLMSAAAARAQTAPESPAQDWTTGITAPALTPQDPAPPGNTSVVPRSGGEGAAEGEAALAQVRLTALLTSDGQKIDRDLVWRVFRSDDDPSGKSKLISTHRTPNPVLRVAPGDYVVNAAFGRANVTRKITVKADAAGETTERFVLNAGGMRVTAKVAETAAPVTSVTYSIYSDRDQTGDRRLIISSVKPGLVIRLNAGIYHIISSVGDANAIVQSDVTVEAGKLTEATVTHSAAKATLKLVSRPGGEALAGTHWTIKTQQGVVVKESSGALPTHVLAPGTYTAIARSQGKTLQRSFTVTDGQATQVEVIIQ